MLKVPSNRLCVNLRMRIISAYFRLMSVNYSRCLRIRNIVGVRGDTDQSDCSQNHDFTVRGIQD